MASPFRYTSDPGLALPLVSLQSQSISIHIEFRELSELTSLSWNAMNNVALVGGTDVVGDIQERPQFKSINSVDAQAARGYRHRPP